MKLMYKKVPARLQELPFHFIIIFDFFYTMCQVSPGSISTSHYVIQISELVGLFNPNAGINLLNCF